MKKTQFFRFWARIAGTKDGSEKKSERFTIATGGDSEYKENKRSVVYPSRIIRIDGRANFILFFDMAKIDGKIISRVSLDIADKPNEKPLSKFFCFSR